MHAQQTWFMTCVSLFCVCVSFQRPVSSSLPLAGSSLDVTLQVSTLRMLFRTRQADKLAEEARSRGNEKKGQKNCVSACARVHVCVRMRVRMRVCVRVCVCVCVFAYACVCANTNHITIICLCSAKGFKCIKYYNLH